MEEQNGKVLLIEPFYGGSHKQLIDFITAMLEKNNVPFDLMTLPAKKWHWRARTSALYMRNKIPHNHKYRVIFCSSVLNLAELIALRPDLATAFKIIYFHENQFVYPQLNRLERDFQYGYNTILSALVADSVVFNSQYNEKTFLNNVSKHLRTQPDFRVDGIAEEIRPKSQIIYFPVVVNAPKTRKTYDVLHIVWPHRWEHDKKPQLFFETMFKLKENGAKFVISVLGESYSEPMTIFEQAKSVLNDRILHFGRLESREEYLATLSQAHVAVSTANHEFFGVAILESVICGCLPIVPNDLVYPELYPQEYLYNTPQQLYKKLRELCQRPYLVRERLASNKIVLDQFDVSIIADKFTNLLVKE